MEMEKTKGMRAESWGTSSFRGQEEEKNSAGDTEKE